MSNSKRSNVACSKEDAISTCDQLVTQTPKSWQFVHRLTRSCSQEPTSSNSMTRWLLTRGFKKPPKLPSISVSCLSSWMAASRKDGVAFCEVNNTRTNTSQGVFSEPVFWPNKPHKLDFPLYTYQLYQLKTCDLMLHLQFRLTAAVVQRREPKQRQIRQIQQSTTHHREANTQWDNVDNVTLHTSKAHRPNKPNKLHQSWQQKR